MTLPEDADRRFEDLVRRYGRLISSIVARVGGRAAGALREDVEQQVLVSLWQQVRREQAITHPASYIYRAAVRETVRVLRRELGRAEQPLDDGPTAGTTPDDPHQALARKEQAAALEGCLESLAPDRGRAVRAHLAGFDVGEIMRLYGWPYQKSRNLVARGMADLRAALLAKGIRG